MKPTKLKDATPQQIREIAELMGTTVNALRHIVHGRRQPNALRAIAIEKAAEQVGLLVPRETLNQGCAKCEFAKACRKSAKVPKK